MNLQCSFDRYIRSRFSGASYSSVTPFGFPASSSSVVTPSFGFLPILCSSSLLLSVTPGFIALRSARASTI